MDDTMTPDQWFNTLLLLVVSVEPEPLNLIFKSLWESGAISANCLRAECYANFILVTVEPYEFTIDKGRLLKFWLEDGFPPLYSVSRY